MIRSRTTPPTAMPTMAPTDKLVSVEEGGGGGASSIINPVLVSFKVESVIMIWGFTRI